MLYSKATGFEKGSEIITPEKAQLINELKEIKEKVNQIYQKKIKGADYQDVNMQMKNEKIVAWLINRNRKSMCVEREEFFRKINQGLVDENENNNYNTLNQEQLGHQVTSVF